MPVVAARQSTWRVPRTRVLIALFRRLRPTLVHLVTLKPVLYGGIAARFVRTPAVVSAVAGLGFLFIAEGGTKAAIIRKLIVPLFRFAFGHSNQKIIFQNREDLDEMVAATGIDPRKALLVRGSGVDIAKYQYVAESDDKPIVAMASRLLRDKGVMEFVEAARLLQQRGTRARFWLIGAPDPANPATVSDAQVEAWRRDGIVECLGQRDDVPDLYARSHVVTLPSYREGLPKALIEAAACGRAVVTTDVPGCRDAIKPGVSGLLVRPRDGVALADALQRLLDDGDTRRRMGRAGRELAEQEFRIENVIAAHLEAYEGLVRRSSGAERAI